jgi:hypothetical protein
MIYMLARSRVKDIRCTLVLEEKHGRGDGIVIYTCLDRSAVEDIWPRAVAARDKKEVNQPAAMHISDREDGRGDGIGSRGLLGGIDLPWKRRSS